MEERPCLFVIFGASGDLTRRRLIPGLFELHVAGLLSPNTAVVGISRSQLSDDEFRERVRSRPHPFYRQQGDLLEVEVPVRMDEAALGTEIEVPLLDAPVRMKIPAGTQPGSVFRVRGKGLPTTGGGRGDAHVRVQVEVPSLCNDEASATLHKLGDMLGDEAYPRRRAFQEMMAAIGRREGE